MRFVLLLVVLFGVCRTDDEIEINEIDSDGSLQRVRNVTLAKIFENAVQAYLEEDWDSCITGFGDALHGYKVYKRMVTICRRKCKAEAAGSSPIFAENIEDLHFYEKKVRETLCLMKCNQDYREIAGAGALKRLPHATERKFVDLAIYEYLHICYFQPINSIASFTFVFPHRNTRLCSPTKDPVKHITKIPYSLVSNLVNYAISV